MTVVATLSQDGTYEVTGVSSDTKPEGVPTGSSFFEQDTGFRYYWTGSVWLNSAAVPNRKTVSNDGTGADFDSVKDAVDWVTANGTPSVSNPWVIEVYPGLYSEAPFTIPAYVTVIGTDPWMGAQLSTTNDGAHFVTLAAGAALAHIQLVGPVNSGFAAIDYTGTGFTPGFLYHVVIRTGYYGVWVHPASYGALHMHELVNRYNGAQIQEFVRASDYGVATLMTSSFMSGPTDAVVKGFCADGANAKITADNCQFRNPGSTIAFCAMDGALLRLNACSISNAGTGIQATGTAASVVRAAGMVIEPDVTVPIETTSSVTRVYFNGSMIEPDVVLASSATLLGIAVGDDGVSAHGVLTAGGSADQVYVSDFLRNSGWTGIISGGSVTRDTGLDIDVALGLGFICVEGTSLKPVSWVADSLTFTADDEIYIYIDADGVLQQATSEPSAETGIIVARATTDATDVIVLASVSVASVQLLANQAQFQQDVIGVINVSGCVVSQYGAPPSLQFEVSSGVFYHLGQRTLEAASGTPATFTYLWASSTPGVWNSLSGQTSLDTGYYDDGSGTLAALTVGYFKRDVAYATVNGSGTEFFVVYGDAEWATAVEAVGNPLVPHTLENHGQRLAAFVLEDGATDIELIVDQRPRLGTFAPASTAGGIVIHNDLSGRDSLTAHDQYQLLTEKGAASGYAPLDAGSLVPGANLPYSAIAGANISSAAAIVGTGDIARVGHTHAVQTAAPTQGIGGGNTQGAGPNLAMSNHDHKLRETSGPTELTIAAVADGQFLIRSGTTIVGSGATTGTTLYRWYNFGGNSVTSIGDYVAVSVASNAGVRLSFAFPPNFASLVSLDIYGIPNSSFTDQDIDLTSDYAAPGELYNAHEQTDITSVYSGVINTIWNLNAAGVFSGAAANDVGGLYVKHNGIGATVYYLGIRMGYIST